VQDDSPLEKHFKIRIQSKRRENTNSQMLTQRLLFIQLKIWFYKMERLIFIS